MQRYNESLKFCSRQPCALKTESERGPRKRLMMHVPILFQTIYWSAVGAAVVFVLLVFFEPPLRYKIRDLPAPPDSEDFCRIISALADAHLHPCSKIELLSDGAEFYPAELAAIANAAKSIHLESFIFHPSAVGDRFIIALANKARQGVKVKVVVDAFGSLRTHDSYLKPLLDAGCEVRWYQPFRFANLKRLNNRTHRKLLIIDGSIGFIGGAGIASHWDIGDADDPPWRDTMFRVEGELAAGLQATFAENWLESSGEILTALENFPQADDTAPGSSSGMIVIGSPTAGRSSRNRILFQVLLAAARKTIYIHSPYFLPDRSASAELVRAACERQVQIRVMVPGSKNNHPLTRLASRRRYGLLLKAGVEIYEYQPGMIHTKILTVDGLWSVVGSTNFDSRSFDLNDEVNMVTIDSGLATRIEKAFTADIAHCRSVKLEDWARRSAGERVLATAACVLERQE